jgi:hypothetical protein
MNMIQTPKVMDSSFFLSSLIGIGLVALGILFLLMMGE